MSLYKRKDSPYWWIKLSHDGCSIQKSTGTPDRLKAREYHDKLKAQLWDVSRLGVKPSHVWEDAVLRWLMKKRTRRLSRTIAGIFGGCTRIWQVASCRRSIEMSWNG